MSFKKIITLLGVMVLMMACERQRTQLSVLSSDAGLIQEGNTFYIKEPGFQGTSSRIMKPDRLNPGIILKMDCSKNSQGHGIPPAHLKLIESFIKAKK